MKRKYVILDKGVSEWDTGIGTTPDMWEMLSDILQEKQIALPVSLNAAIVALSSGDAYVLKTVLDDI